MIKSESESSNSNNKPLEEKICNLNYLSDTMGGNKKLMAEIIEVFLLQVPEELQAIDDAIKIVDYVIIKNYAHSMKSTVSIMGMSVLMPVLQEMEDLGAKANDIEKIKQLNQKLNIMCQQAIEEIKNEELNYV